jgi:hypothetical protein
MNAQAFFEAIGGLPFINDDAQAMTLLTAVACIRRNSAPDAHEALADYLLPENARALFKRLARSQVDEFESTPCSSLEQQEIAAATARICQINEGWHLFFAIPIRYRKLVQSMSSSTSALIPQTIYLGKRAFESNIPLEEVLVHEHAHVWLNFVMEAYDLQTEDAPRDYVLPSGTSGKTLRGVMAAAHFAAAALRFYRSQNDRLASSARQAYLRQYLAGCLEIASQRPSFTPMGSLVARALNDFYQDLTM